MSDTAEFWLMIAISIVLLVAACVGVYYFLIVIYWGIAKAIGYIILCIFKGLALLVAIH
jgi:hypothetical protein